MIHLNNAIMDKFNKLFAEVAKYYNLADKIHQTVGGVYLLLEDLGCDDRSEMTSVSELLDKINENYPYLVPFVKVSKAQIFGTITGYQKYVDESTFKEINMIVKKIRKENGRR